MTANPRADPATQRRADRLEAVVESTRRLAEKLGLKPYPVNYWLVDHDEMNAIAAYDGFQTRYPHWRWGMKYDRRRKEDRYGAGKIFELVNNDDPAHAFLQESNPVVSQKAVIAHVEAHSDFFANNAWYGLFADEVDAAAMLERHARRIRAFMEDPEIDRSEVEAWIDHVLAIEDTIDQHRSFEVVPAEIDADTPAAADPADAELELRDEVREAVFSGEDSTSADEDEEPSLVPGPSDRDVLAYLRSQGQQFDEATGRAVDREPWQNAVIDMLRAEAYYFAPQKMTKVMNEGFAAYFESIMMTEEALASAGEFVDYADHHAKVLGGAGFNPYKLGKALWQYVENRANRREVAERLLRVDGISPSNFHDRIDFDVVRANLAPPEAIDAIAADALDALGSVEDELVDADGLAAARAGEFDVEAEPWRVVSFTGLARRHYSLLKPQHRRFIERIGTDELEELDRYLVDVDRYETVQDALDDVDFTAGWNELFAVRESHNDVTFIDEFLTAEFVEQQGYFAYEHSETAGQPLVSSTDPAAVKRKLLLQFTNFGKPTITVADGNFDNRGELLLAHQYNGVMLDVSEAKRTLERLFELWGRPVNLVTIVKEYDEGAVSRAQRHGAEPTPEEEGRRIRYDGETFETHDLDWDEVEAIAATEVDYDTRPDDWL